MGSFTCPHCQAVYSVTFRRVPAREAGTAHCVECGKIMVAWSHTVIPSFSLKRLADGSESHPND